MKRHGREGKRIYSGKRRGRIQKLLVFSPFQFYDQYSRVSVMPSSVGGMDEGQYHESPC